MAIKSAASKARALASDANPSTVAERMETRVVFMESVDVPEKHPRSGKVAESRKHLRPRHQTRLSGNDQHAELVHPSPPFLKNGRLKLQRSRRRIVEDHLMISREADHDD